MPATIRRKPVGSCSTSLALFQLKIGSSRRRCALTCRRAISQSTVPGSIPAPGVGCSSTLPLKNALRPHWERVRANGAPCGVPAHKAAFNEPRPSLIDSDDSPCEIGMIRATESRLHRMVHRETVPTGFLRCANRIEVSKMLGDHSSFCPPNI
jgi:hypothetical protein